jgi:hypothetical protein
MSIDITIEAIKSLVPNSSFTVKTNEEIVWLDETHTQPTQEDIIQKVAELEYLEEVNEYQRKRKAEYPDYADYLDGVVKGDQDQIDAYIAACQAVKDKYPKAEVDETELASHKAQALFDYRLDQYTKAVDRLSQYELSVGQEKVTEDVVVGTESLIDSDGNYSFDSDGNTIEINITEVRVIKETIDPLPATVFESQFDSDGNPIEVEVPNPLIVNDEAERAAAQDVINNTEQAVIDHYEANQ